MFYEGVTIDNFTFVPGTVAQYSSESEYNEACTAGMDLAHSRMINNEFLNNDTDVFLEQTALTILDIKSAICMAKNGKDTNHTRHITRGMHF